MSKDNKPQAPVAAEKCKAEDCKKGNQKFGFCLEHYDWYMEGVLRGDGRKPSDFAEKLSNWQRKKSHKAA